MCARQHGLSSSHNLTYNLAITCWPNETGDGNCDVSVEYELQQDHLELADVSIRIPIPSGVGAPVVGSCDGDYNHDSRKNILEWNLPVIGKLLLGQLFEIVIMMIQTLQMAMDQWNLVLLEIQTTSSQSM